MKNLFFLFIKSHWKRASCKIQAVLLLFFHNVVRLVLDLIYADCFVFFALSVPPKSRKKISFSIHPVSSGEMDGMNFSSRKNCDKLSLSLVMEGSRQQPSKYAKCEKWRLGKSHLNLNFINQTFDNLWLSIIEQCSFLLSFDNLHINVVRNCSFVYVQQRNSCCRGKRVRESMFAWNYNLCNLKHDIRRPVLLPGLVSYGLNFPLLTDPFIPSRCTCMNVYAESLD